ncbi:MAG: glycosyltransferase [Campylobacterota bacterium]|nr:glycosyltransferase [Campylobacterota bacterium]
MKKLNIAIKNKTKLTQELEKLYDISYYKELGFFSKIFEKEIEPDIYFHQGVLNEYAYKMIEKSDLVIVNAKQIKAQIIQKYPELPLGKVIVLYPYYNAKLEYSKEIKTKFREHFELEKNDRVILFQAKNLNKSGIEHFFEILESLRNENFIVLVESTAKEIQRLKPKINKKELPFKVRYFEDYDQIDELFIFADIFILPTELKLFAQSVLKAIYFKNAVFITQTNYSAEFIDTFSRITDSNDRSIPFKVDALLANKDELKKIQKENHQKSLNYSLESRVEKVDSIIKKII